MLSVILIWIYIIATTYCLGYAFLSFLSNLPCMCEMRQDKAKPYSVRFRETYIICGIILVTVYAQIWSLFGRVSVASVIILTFICIAVMIPHYSKVRNGVKRQLLAMKSTRSTWIYVLLFLLFAYGASHGISHYDTGLYHAQAIRWIENYGAVKGLGNLHLRLAYNSAAFPLSAIYSFSFVPSFLNYSSRSFHTVQGFLALLLAWQSVDIRNFTRRKRPVVGDFVRLFAIYYLFTIFDEMVSPASDYFVLTLILYVIIQWLDLDAEGEKRIFPYAMLSAVIVFAVTIKLSAAPFALLLIKPVFMLLQKRKKILQHENNNNAQKTKSSAKKKTQIIKFPIGRIQSKSYKRGIIVYILCILTIIVPYFARNFVLSGWLIYPFTGIDIFNVSWKVPKGEAALDAKEIRAFGRGLTSADSYDTAFSTWFPKWMSTLGTLNKFVLLADVICLVIFIGMLIYYLRCIRNADKKIGKVVALESVRMVSTGDFLFIEGVSLVALVFWFVSSPLIRYGSVFVFLPFVLMMGRLIVLIYIWCPKKVKLVIYRAAIAIGIVFLCYKAFRLVRSDAATFNYDNLIIQQDYEKFETASYIVDEKTFYYPVNGDRTGYDAFPSVPYKKSDFELIGDDIGDGFKAVE